MIKNNPKIILEKEKAGVWSLKVEINISDLHDEAEEYIEEGKDKLANIVMKATLEVGGKTLINTVSKLTENKNSHKNHKEMKVRTKMDNNDLTERAKLINYVKVRSL